MTSEFISKKNISKDNILRPWKILKEEEKTKIQEKKMAYNFQHNKSPQPFGGRGVKQQSNTAGSGRNVAVPAAAASPFRPTSSSPLPMAPRMSAPMDHAASPGPGVMLRRQLLSPPCGTSSSPQSSPCPSPVTAGGRLRPHSIALASGEGGTPQQQLQQFLGNVALHLFFFPPQSCSA